MTGRPLRLVLVGMMGAGKTTVGRALAARLGWAFLDLDDLVEQAAGRTVGALFAQEGEAGFRRREEQALAWALALERVVIATGGGVVLSEANRAKLAAEPWVVWLEAPPEELARRLAGQEAAGRPLLAGAAAEAVSMVGASRELGASPAGGSPDHPPAVLAQRLAQLLQQRAGAYAAVARYRIPTAGRPVAAVTEAVLEHLLPVPVPGPAARPGTGTTALGPHGPSGSVTTAPGSVATVPPPGAPPHARAPSSATDPAAAPSAAGPGTVPSAATAPPGASSAPTAPAAVAEPDLLIEAGAERYPLWVRPGAVAGTGAGTVTGTAGEVGLEALLAAAWTGGVPAGGTPPWGAPGRPGPAATRATPGAAGLLSGPPAAGPLAEERPAGQPGGGAPVALLASDPVVSALYGGRVARALERAGFRVVRAVVPAGEEAKSLEWASRLYDRLVEAGAGRDAWVFALGGGVVGDLAGFVAATYMRGIAFAQLPTTLLAQVDASAGGKVAVNHPRAKNLIGAFHQPRLVVADPATLATQPQAAYRGGLAEMVKHALLDGEGHLAALEAAVPRLLDRDPHGLAPLIARSVAVKARIVAQDPEERGPRAFLNLGHTFAHALEAAAGYRVPHGDAVAAGLVLALALSERLGMAPAGLAGRVEELLARLGLPVTLAQACREWGVEPPTAAELLGRLQHDKKNRQGRVRFVLLGAPGQIALRDDVPEAVVKELVGRSLAGRSPAAGAGRAQV
ncbi:3-dehydroquinate synthase [Thermaerobacter sp. PB12/4term]|uniref:3-dehydroquinate synthase n=1 Tax=Thermaerobacter sp. PB12/4term TaxID=2293838 RepID=UPI000E32C662|nr:3-dehydroquinate synthase [Thermaerobacter sp. PB12/4term]QIA26276.1 3-dehydroquinate synthase [Thermaerobacter sp. PB12/4term]